MKHREFQKLVNPFVDSWYRYVLIMTNDKDLANDCIQDVMLKLWDKRNKFEKINDLNSYGFIMVRNDLIRKLNFKKNSFTVNIGEIEKNNWIEPVNKNYEELLHKTLRLTEELPEKRREIFILRVINDLSYEDIMEITGNSINTIRVQVSLARKFMRKRLPKILDQ